MFKQSGGSPPELREPSRKGQRQREWARYRANPTKNAHKGSVILSTTVNPTPGHTTATLVKLTIGLVNSGKSFARQGGSTIETHQELDHLQRNMTRNGFRQTFVELHIYNKHTDALAEIIKPTPDAERCRSHYDKTLRDDAPTAPISLYVKAHIHRHQGLLSLKAIHPCSSWLNPLATCPPFCYLLLTHLPPSCHPLATQLSPTCHPFATHLSPHLSTCQSFVTW